MISNVVETVAGNVFQADAIDLIKTLADESVDLVITDPAYASLEKWRSTGTTTRLSHSKGSSNDWFPIFPNDKYTELFKEFYRVLKPGTFMYLFCDEETRDVVCSGYSPQIEKFTGAYKGEIPPLITAGFKYWKSLIFDKVHRGMGYHFPAQHEFIVMAEKVVRKGKHRKLNTNLSGDVLSVPRLKGKQYWPTQKPVELVWKLITESTNPGDCVLDPFVGGGTTAAAALLSNRKFIVGDIDKKAVEFTLKRLESMSKSETQ
jgi:site-specific DNA-methyltransferase (adenine-specific)